METQTRTLTSLNPATLSPIGEVPMATADEVHAAVADVRVAQRAWGETPLDERARIMRRVSRAVAGRAEDLARALTAEGGKTLFQSYAAEVMPTAETFRWLAKFAPRHLGVERLRHASLLFKAKKSYLHFEPMGVIGIISPWNYPLAIPATEIGFALAAGNGVVLKPSEHTPLIADRFRDVLVEAGVPAALVRIVHGEGDVGAALVEAGPDKMIFTGSVRTGRRVAAACGERGIPITLELGGKDAMIVRADADLERAVAGALFGSTFNAGQTCAAVERIYVHRDVADVFTERLAEAAGRLRVGDPSLPTTDVGPMIHATQRRIVEDHVADAEARGARVLAGGVVETGLRGAFFAPAVVADVPDDAPLMREETFGPVVPVRIVESDDEAVSLANDSPFGLTASVWTKDVRAARSLAQRIEAGTVFVNDVLYSYASPDAPWGGVKSSGAGLTHSRYGLHELSRVKHVSIEPSWIPQLLAYPYSEDLVDGMRHLTRALYGKGGGRLRSLRKAVGAVRRGMASGE